MSDKVSSTYVKIRNKKPKNKLSNIKTIVELFKFDDETNLEYLSSDDKNTFLTSDINDYFLDKNYSRPFSLISIYFLFLA